MIRLLGSDDRRLLSLLLYDCNSVVSVCLLKYSNRKDLLSFQKISSNKTVPKALLSSFHATSRYIGNNYGSLNSQTESCECQTDL